MDTTSSYTRISPTSLRYTLHDRIDDAITLDTIEKATGQHPFSGLAPYPGEVFAGLGKEVKALVGTPSGVSIAYLVIRHKKLEQRRRVQSVRVWSAKAGSGDFVQMLIELNESQVAMARTKRPADDSAEGSDRLPPGQREQSIGRSRVTVRAEENNTPRTASIDGKVVGTLPTSRLREQLAMTWSRARDLMMMAPSTSKRMISNTRPTLPRGMLSNTIRLRHGEAESCPNSSTNRTPSPANGRTTMAWRDLRLEADRGAPNRDQIQLEARDIRPEDLWKGGGLF